MFKKSILFLFYSLTLLLPFSLSSAVITSNAVAGNWNAGGSWVGGVAPVAGDDAIIVNGATITVTVAANITNVTIQSGGTLTANAALTINAAATFNINGGGTYIHANATAASTTIFNGTEMFAATSTVRINTWSATATPLVTGVGVNFGHLILSWNTGGILWNNNGLGIAPNAITGNFTVQNSCATYLNNVVGNLTYNIGGNFIMASSGYLEVKRAVTGNVIFNVAGNTTLGAGTAFRGIFANGANATGTFTYTTVGYSQTAGTWRGTDYNTSGPPFNIPWTAGGDVTFTATGAFTISGGQHIGVNYPYAGNWGKATYNMPSFTLTGGSIILCRDVITDGRTNTWNVTGNFSCTFVVNTDFAEFDGISGGATQNDINSLNVTGNFSIAGAAVGVYQNKWDGTGADNMVIGGDLSVTGGTVDFTSGVGCTATGILTQTVAGNVTFTGGTTAYNTTAGSRLDLILGTAAINWNQTAATVTLCNTNLKNGKTVSLSGTSMGAIATSHIITVETGAKLYCANATVNGAGAFNLMTGTTIGVGSIAGITSAGATGNVQVTGTRTYNSGATYEYYQGLTPQITGNFTTTTTSGTYPCQVANMVINKSLATDIVTLTNTTDIISPGVLTLTTGVLTTSYTASTAPWVRIPSGSSVSPVGGSATSYVDGYIRKQGNVGFIFPTGNAGRWRRIALVSPSGTTEFEARYIDAAYANTSTMAGSPTPVLNHVSLIEHWFLTKPGGADAVTAKVKLYWEDASTSGILKFDSMVVARWSGTGWENTSCYGSCPANWTTSQPERTYTGSATGTGAGTIQSNTVSSFSPFTIASLGVFALNPLPVELVEFNGVFDGFVNVLDWATESETNNDYFTIERTMDGINFEEVKRVQGNGTSSQRHSYSITDDKQYSGTAYYRLKQTDFNGQSHYSNLISISHSVKDQVSIYPNPVRGTDLTIDYSSSVDGSGVVTIMDITGKEVMRKSYEETSGTNSVKLDVSELSAGVYFVLVRTNDEMRKIKFVKQ